MLKLTIFALVTAFLFSTSCNAGSDSGRYRLLDLKRKTELPLSQVVSELKKSRIVLVGEQHSNVAHHRAQLAVIHALKEAGVEVAIGLEMFRHESQSALDQWVSGEIDPQSFEKIYYDNWNFPWQAYGMIFEYARAHKIPMIGLNVPREITRKVSRDGFKSLSPEQKGQLAEVSCVVDQQYMNYIRQAFGEIQIEIDVVLSQLGPDQTEGTGHSRIQREGPPCLVGGITGEGTKMVHRLRHPVHQAPHLYHHLLQLVIAQVDPLRDPRHDVPGRHRHRRQRLVELVRHARRHLTQGNQPRRLQQLRLQLPGLQHPR